MTQNYFCTILQYVIEFCFIEKQRIEKQLIKFTSKIYTINIVNFKP